MKDTTKNGWEEEKGKRGERLDEKWMKKNCDEIETSASSPLFSQAQQNIWF